MIWFLHSNLFPHFLPTLPQIHWSLCRSYHMALIPAPLWNILPMYLTDTLAHFITWCTRLPPCISAPLVCQVPSRGRCARAVHAWPGWPPCSPHFLITKVLPLCKVLHFPSCSTSYDVSAGSDITPFYLLLVLIKPIISPWKWEVLHFVCIAYLRPRRVTYEVGAQTMYRSEWLIKQLICSLEHPGTQAGAAPSARFRHPEQNQWVACVSFSVQAERHHTSVCLFYFRVCFNKCKTTRSKGTTLLWRRRAVGQRRDISSTYSAELTLCHFKWLLNTFTRFQVISVTTDDILKLVASGSTHS